MSNSRELIDHLVAGRTNDFKRGVENKIYDHAKEYVDLKRVEIGQSLFDESTNEEESED